MNDSEIGSAVRALIIAWLDWHAELDRRERTSELEDRVEGYRVVNGGQIDSNGTWEITDAETGEHLASGVGFETFGTAWQDSWTHVDRIADDAHEATRRPVEDFGLPPGILRVLVDWVIDRPDEARMLIDS